MTKLSGTASVSRETLAVWRGRELMVTVTAHDVQVREKGRRKGYSVPIIAVFELGAKLAARQAAAEKLEMKKRRKKT